MQADAMPLHAEDCLSIKITAEQARAATTAHAHLPRCVAARAALLPWHYSHVQHMLQQIPHGATPWP
jgi:hypothetical protein